jgi:hypothetical protein
MTDTEKDTVQTESGIAVLQEDFNEGDGPFTVSGIALGVDDVTHGKSGVPTLWSAEVLRDAATRFEGIPLAKNDHDPMEQPNADNVVGEVTEAKFRPGIGVAFKGRIIDADIARKIDEGLLDVSPVMARTLADEAVEVNGEEVRPAESIDGVREIGIVMSGAAPSNTITTGTSATAALSREALSQVFAPGAESDDDEPTEALVNVNGTEVDLSPPEAMVNAADAAAEAGEAGLIPSDCGTGVGDRRRTQIKNGNVGTDVVREIASYLVSHEEDVTADGTPTDWSDDEWGDCGNAQYAKWGGTGGGSAMEWAMRRVNEIDRARGNDVTYPEVAEDDTDADEAAETTEPTDDGETDEPPEDADEALETVAGVTFDDTMGGDLDEGQIPTEGFAPHYMYPGDTKTESTYPVVDADGNLRRGNVLAAHTLGCRGRCDDADEHDRRVTTLARQFDDVPAFAQEDEANEANEETETDTDTDTDTDMSEDDEPDISDEERELLSEARKHDDAVVMGESEVEALREEVSTAKDAYAEVLADLWGTDSEKIADNFGLEALREEVEGLGDEDDDGVEALAQTPESGTADTDDEDVDDTPDEEALERIEEIETKFQYVGSALPETRKEELRQEACELAGTDDFNEALETTEV